MSDHSLRHGRLLHASSSAGSVIGQVGGSPSVHTDINSAGTSLSSGGSETAWSAPDVPSPLVTPAEAFPFPHLQLHRPPLRPASSSNSTPLVLGASRHFFTPIHSGVRGLTRATPLLDLALCPAQTGDVTEKRHVAVMSRHSLKIMDMRPPKPTFAAAAANGAGLRRASSSPSVSATSATPQNATELIDVKAAGKLTKYGFTTLTWGYNVSADTVATGATDGTVMLWDVSSAKPQNANRLDRKRSQHDRSVNQVAFAGPSGVWLISAGQDGAVKLWDTRMRSDAAGGTSQLTLTTDANPIRALAVHPVRTAPQLFHLCSLSEGGALTHWDIRSSRTYQSRVPAHFGAGLCLDWVERISPNDSDGHDPLLALLDSPPADASTWLATGGMDSTVKVFPFTDGLASKPVSTLHTSSPVSRVRWTATRAAEIAVIPLGSNTNAFSSATSMPNLMPDSAEKTTQNLVNEIEVWDLHRPHVPKSVLRSGLGSVSAMVCAPAPDADILWATHKDHALLAQHDLAHDAQRPLENVAKAAVTWSPMGELAFVHALQSQHQDCPIDHDDHAPQVTATLMADDQTGQSLTAADIKVFARSIRVSGSSILDACSYNARVARQLNHPELSIAWSSLALIFDASGANCAAPMAPHAAPEHVFAHPIHPFHPLKLADHSADDSPVRHFTYQTENVPLSAASMKQRFSRSRSLSRQSQRTANPQPLADFTEESSSGPGSEETEEAHTLIRHSSVHHFSRAEHELSDLDPENDALSSSVQALHRNPLPAQNRSRTASAPVAPIKPGMPRSYSYHGHSLAESSQVTTHVDRHSSSESELTSPIDETAPGSANGLSKRKLPRSITANAVTALTRNSRSRTRRGPSLALDHGKAIAQQGKALDRRDASNSLAISTLRREKDTQEALARHAFAVRSAEDALATMQEALFQRLPQTLQEMADQGHLQFCVQAMHVLRPELHLDAAFQIRCELAYLDILRRLELHQEAAALAKHSTADSVQELSEADTKFHVSCGSCGKAILSPPYNRCQHCSKFLYAASIMACTLCRLSCHVQEKGSFVHCLTCGHSAHRACLHTARQGTSSDLQQHGQCPSGCGHGSNCPLSISI